MRTEALTLETPAISRAKSTSGLAILYEHPAWFERLFAELNRRGLSYSKFLAPEHFYSADAEALPFKVLFNRMSPSADRRGHDSGILYTLSYLGHLELLGVRVINRSKAYGYEISKALQLSLLQSLGLPYPKSRVIHGGSHALKASEGLRFPIVVKPNVGGSGAGVVRFNSRGELAAAVAANQLHLGFDHVGLVQEFIQRAEAILRALKRWLGNSCTRSMSILRARLSICAQPTFARLRVAKASLTPV
jgi:glutathione synthase/RimK-type ligase-like ATP-grasp enzyme